MNSIIASMTNEMQKLMAKRITILFLIAAAVLPVAIKLMVHNLPFMDWMALPAENINFSILDFFVKVMLPLFCFIAVADLFTGEAERGTLFPIRPINRFELFISKTAAIGNMIGIQLILGSLSVVISSVFFDTSFLLEEVLTTFVAFFLSWFPLLVLIAFAVFTTSMVKSSVVAISILFSLYLAMIIFPVIFPASLYLLPSSYLDWYIQWLGDISFRWAAQSFTYLSSLFALLLASAFHFFNKKEA